MTRYVLAQANWARMLTARDDPAMRSFDEQLDEVNRFADESPGFVWRYVEEPGPSAFRALGDTPVLFNMSTWESIEALAEFTYRSLHAGVLRDRGRWFHTPDRAPVVLWWQPRERVPDVVLATEKFEHLWEHGPTPAAFHLRTTFPAPTG